MGELGAHCAKGNKTGTERKVLHDLTSVLNLKKSNTQRQRVEHWLPGWGGGGNREILVKEYKIGVI